MTTSRSYNVIKNFEDALVEVCANAGTQFDMDVAYALCKAMCKECTCCNIGLKDNIGQNGLLSSKESFDYLCENVLEYHYDRPPTYNEDDTLKQPTEVKPPYTPNTDEISKFAEALESIDAFKRYCERCAKIKALKDELFSKKRKLPKENLSSQQQKELAGIESALEKTKCSLSTFLSDSSLSEKVQEVQDTLEGRNDDNNPRR